MAARSRALYAVGIILFVACVSWFYGTNWSPIGGEKTSSWSSQLDNENTTSRPPVLGIEDNPASFYFPSRGPTKAFTIAQFNVLSSPRPRTPLFIGFTQNNGMLRQTLLSYLAVGWPPEDIIVVDNSGTMDANSLGKLSKQNTFFLDYQYIHSLGVSILQTPTLLTFAQLQNFYLRTAIGHDWPYFFWSHMDGVVLGDEHETPFTPFYQGVLDVIDQVRDKNDWALKWFSYDALTMVNPEAWRDIGSWDPFIPYYHADCDMYSRMVLAGFNRQAADAHAGTIFDLAEVMPNLETSLFASSTEEQPNSARYQALRKTLERMEKDKKENKGGRNTWQSSHSNAAATRDELWSYDAKAFRWAWWRTAEKGKEIYKQKWGSMECNMDGTGASLSQMWKNVPT